MTEVKSEITLKFNELPEATPAPNKKVEISLTDKKADRKIARQGAKASLWQLQQALDMPLA